MLLQDTKFHPPFTRLPGSNIKMSWRRSYKKTDSAYFVKFLEMYLSISMIKIKSKGFVRFLKFQQGCRINTFLLFYKQLSTVYRQVRATFGTQNE